MENTWLKKLIVSVSALLIGAFAILLWDVYCLMKDPMLPPTKPPLVLNLENQSSAQQFVNRLKNQGLIRSAKLFRFMIRIQGLSPQLKAGIYMLKPGESAFQFLYRVIDGDVLVEPFAIIEGSTVTQITEKLKQAPYMRYEASDWMVVQGEYKSPEGLLLADTYQYQAGTASLRLMKQANRELWAYLNERWKDRELDLPYRSPYELLIAASIIEKEAALPDERKLIAGVLVNRLKRNMRLQMDPTVIYALGADFKGRLSRRDLALDSPYNTYKYSGLPPTPIAMVGKNAIDAAAHPMKTNFFYYVSKGDGSHQFSETYTQQKKAVYRYQIKEN